MSHADPAASHRRAGSRLIQNELRLMLLRWDPIGVADELAAADEYDCMIGPLFRLLNSAATTDEITTWLASELNEHFGLAAVPSSNQRFAIELQRWWTDGAKARETQPPSI